MPPSDQIRLARQLGFYDDLIRLLERHQIIRPNHKTPREFSDSLSYLPSESFQTIRRSPAIFYRIRYGRREISAPRQRLLGNVILRFSTSCSAAVATSPVDRLSSFPMKAFILSVRRRTGARPDRRYQFRLDQRAAQRHGLRYSRATKPSAMYRAMICNAIRELARPASICSSSRRYRPDRRRFDAAILAEVLNGPARDERHLAGQARRILQTARPADAKTNLIQAMIPQGATMLDNPAGTARNSGRNPQKDGGRCTVFRRAGRAKEMKAMFELHIRPL